MLNLYDLVILILIVVIRFSANKISKVVGEKVGEGESSWSPYLDLHPFLG